jgi:hypothetical protein
MAYVESHIPHWLDLYDVPIKIVRPEPHDNSSRAGIGIKPRGESSGWGTQKPCNLHMHMEEELQLKTVQYHPDLVNRLLAKLDAAVEKTQTSPETSTWPPDSRCDILFSGPPKRVYSASNKWQLHDAALSVLDPATLLASSILLLSDGNKLDDNIPITLHVNNHNKNIFDSVVAFNVLYCKTRDGEERVLA